MSGHHHKCNNPLDENNPSPLHHVRMISFPEIRYLLRTSGFRIDVVTTNRVKAISWLYAIYVPFVCLFTSVAYSKAGKKEGTAKINSEIKRTMFSKSILFGETMIVKAKKVAE